MVPEELPVQPVGLIGHRLPEELKPVRLPPVHGHHAVGKGAHLLKQGAVAPVGGRVQVGQGPPPWGEVPKLLQEAREVPEFPAPDEVGVDQGVPPQEAVVGRVGPEVGPKEGVHLPHQGEGVALALVGLGGGKPDRGLQLVDDVGLPGFPGVRDGEGGRDPVHRVPPGGLVKV